ncbi:MAG: D-aminoacyl-tRNA deacylase, partial [Clostridium sp.]|nr:D-aminoacyl-tRNA deacylase [Clostridium sp.]
MRVVVQRVTSSKVIVDGNIVGEIGKGFNLLIGISKDDTIEDLKYIKDKVVNLRVFEDENDKLNLSLLDIKGEILAISQFTLYGDCRKGRRPNFMNAMGGEEAEKLYETFVALFKETGLKVECGKFGA